MNGHRPAPISIVSRVAPERFEHPRASSAMSSSVPLVMVRVSLYVCGVMGSFLSALGTPPVGSGGVVVRGIGCFRPILG